MSAYAHVCARMLLAVMFDLHGEPLWMSVLPGSTATGGCGARETWRCQAHS